MDEFDKLFKVFDYYSDIRITQLPPEKCKCLCCTGDIVVYEVDGDKNTEVGRGETFKQAIEDAYKNI